MSRTNPRVVGQPGQSILADDPASRTRRVRVLARLLDNSISIPGTGWKIGFDPIVGLIPGIGDLIGAVLSGYIILEAARAEVPGYTLARMLVNVGIDTVLGSIPAGIALVIFPNQVRSGTESPWWKLPSPFLSINEAFPPELELGVEHLERRDGDQVRIESGSRACTPVQDSQHQRRNGSRDGTRCDNASCGEPQPSWPANRRS